MQLRLVLGEPRLELLEADPLLRNLRLQPPQLLLRGLAHPTAEPFGLRRPLHLSRRRALLRLELGVRGGIEPRRTQVVL